MYLVEPFPFPYHQLSIARFRFTFWAESEVVFYTLPASHWRSAFGSLLHDAPPQAIPRFHQEAYQQLFNPVNQTPNDKRDPTRPIILDPDPWMPSTISKGALFHLNISIFGKKYKSISTLLRAALALQERGVGDDRASTKGRFRLLCLEQNLPDGSTIPLYDAWQPAKPSDWFAPIMKPPSTQKIEEWLRPDHSTPLTIHFIRPLNFRIKGKPVKTENFTFSEFIRALHRRLVGLIQGDLDTKPASMALEGLLQEAENVQILSQKLSYQDTFKRYSTRQMQEIALSGITGQWILSGVSQLLLTLLNVGMLTHCGKNTVMGLGKYEL